MSIICNRKNSSLKSWPFVNWILRGIHFLDRLRPQFSSKKVSAKNVNMLSAEKFFFNWTKKTSLIQVNLTDIFALIKFPDNSHNKSLVHFFLWVNYWSWFLNVDKVKAKISIVVTNWSWNNLHWDLAKIKEKSSMCS